MMVYPFHQQSECHNTDHDFEDFCTGGLCANASDIETVVRVKQGLIQLPVYEADSTSQWALDRHWIGI